MQDLKNLIHDIHMSLIDIRYLTESARLNIVCEKTTEASEKLNEALEEIDKILGDI